MKVLAIPAPVKATIPVGQAQGGAILSEREVTFPRFLRECLKMNDMFKRGPKNARSYMSLCAILEAVTPEQTEISFGDEDFAKVKVCVDGALWMTAEINAAYVPFYDAVDAVKDVPNSNSGK
jgi:hypothetical protein